MQDTPQTSGHRQPNHEAIQNVIDNLLDSQEAFQQIGQRLEDEVVKRFVIAESLRRAEFRGELDTILHHEGLHDIDETGTVAGAVHRLWARLQSSLGGGDHALLSTVESVEDGVLDSYHVALDSNLPLATVQILRTQENHVKLSHDYLHAAREHSQAA